MGHHREYSMVIALIVTVITMIYVHYSDDMNVQTRREEWAKVIQVKEEVYISEDSRAGNTSYNYSWVTIRLNDGNTLKMSVRARPSPVMGSCIPVLVSQFASGEWVARLSVAKWRMMDATHVNCL